MVLHEGALLCKRGRDEDGGETTNSVNKWSIASVENLITNVFVIGVSTTIDSNSEDDKYLDQIRGRIQYETGFLTYHYCHDLE